MQSGRQDFLDATEGLLLPREVEAAWLQVAAWAQQRAKRALVTDWRTQTLSMTCGSSVGWMGLRLNSFPCVRPGKKYLVLAGARAMVPSTWQLIALQGIQAQEIEAFALEGIPSNLVGDFAGNMFSTNVVAAFVLAYLSDPD